MQEEALAVGIPQWRPDSGLPSTPTPTSNGIRLQRSDTAPRTGQGGTRSFTKLRRASMSPWLGVYKTRTGRCTKRPNKALFPPNLCWAVPERVHKGCNARSERGEPDEPRNSDGLDDALPSTSEDLLQVQQKI